MESNNWILNYGRILGLLEAFETINHKTNHGFSFDLSSISKEGNPGLDTIQNHFSKHFETFQIIPIDSPKDYLQEQLKNWFFDYLSGNTSISYCLIDSGNNFYMSDTQEQDRYIQEWVELLLTTLNPQKVNTLKDCVSIRFYACDFTEILFDAQDYVFILHLSWSD